MKAVSREQAVAIMAVLMSNVDWDELDGKILQDEIVAKPIESGKRFTQFLKNGVRIVDVKQPDLLKRITTVKVVLAVQRFCAKDCLKEANVGCTGSNFDKLFRDKVEENVPEAKLEVSCLQKASLDAPILTELGDKAEVYLAYMFDLLKKQAKGEDGVLLTSGYVNIFYVRDTDGNLWAVCAVWRSDYRYWYVEAFSVEYPYGWFVGYQVFSRDS